MSLVLFSSLCTPEDFYVSNLESILYIIQYDSHKYFYFSSIENNIKSYYIVYIKV